MGWFNGTIPLWPILAIYWADWILNLVAINPFMGLLLRPVIVRIQVKISSTSKICDMSDKLGPDCICYRTQIVHGLYTKMQKAHSMRV